MISTRTIPGRCDSSLLGWLLTICVFALSSSASAAVSVPGVFGNDMLLQRDLPVAVWGWAAGDEKVSVTLGSAHAQTVADQDGAWRVNLPAQPAGGPYTLTIAGTNTLSFTNVLVGELWIVSGQQTVTRGIGEAQNKDQEVAGANHPSIRLMSVRSKGSGLPLEEVDGDWHAVTPDTIWRCTAMSYFFARELQRTLSVPIGIITLATDGPGIDQFIPAFAFHLMPDFAGEIQRIDEADREYAAGYAAAVDRLAAFLPGARKDLASGHQVEPPPEYHHRLDNWAPTALFNGLIAPWTRMTLRGVIWIHGESNWGDGVRYGKYQEILVRGWRTAFGREDLPFYCMQLPPFRYDANQPLRLPEFWEGQATILKLPHTGMAWVSDLDNTDNHLPNKQEASRRLALCALAKTYGVNVVDSGPVYRSCAFAVGKATIVLGNAAGLAARDGKALTWFSLAGADKKFVPATAVIVGETVVVSAAGLADPVAVRFAWDQEARPNLINGAGLPGIPFRTDDWPLR